MTTLPTMSSSPTTERVSSTGPATGASSPSGRGRALEPDFVDERIRAEMATLQYGLNEAYWEESESGSECSYKSSETSDFDEVDLQQLTRERGFGLGSWVDRLVGWTLFGAEEWPVDSSEGLMGAARIGSTDTTTKIMFEELVAEKDMDMLSLVEEADLDGNISHDETDACEKPGVQGGWEDAAWLLRVVKRTFI